MKILHFNKLKRKWKKRYVYIGRAHYATAGVHIGPFKWGNPFIVGSDGNRKEVIEKYALWILTQPHLMNSLKELRRKDLVCWCAPLPCHGEVLKHLCYIDAIKYIKAISGQFQRSERYLKRYNERS